MEPVLFYGIPQGCSFGSIVALEWLNQPYRLCRVNMLEDMQSDLYAQVNPARETPVLLLEDGSTLTQSAAILQNIAARGISKALASPGTRERSPQPADRVSHHDVLLIVQPVVARIQMEENPPVKTMLANSAMPQCESARARGGDAREDGVAGGKSAHDCRRVLYRRRSLG